MTMMLNDQTLVKKQHCRQFSDMTIQSFYRFNTSSTIKQTAWTNSDDCLRYEVSMLPETNVFLGIVLTNTTCPSREEVTFCPCSVTGRQCILCQDQVYILKEFLVFFCFSLWANTHCFDWFLSELQWILNLRLMQALRINILILNLNDCQQIPCYAYYSAIQLHSAHKPCPWVLIRFAVYNFLFTSVLRA